MISLGDGLLPNQITINDKLANYEGHSVLTYQNKYLGIIENIAASNLTFVDFALNETNPLSLSGKTSENDIILGGFGNDTISTISGQDIILASRGDDIVTVDGSPGVGSYGVDTGGPIFGTTAYTFRENTNGFNYIKLDITDPDNDPVTSFSIVGGADSDRLWVNSNGYIELDWSSRNFEDPNDANGDNIYEVRVRAQTPDGNYTEQDITIEITDDGKSEGSEWFDSQNDTPAWLSSTSINYVVGQGSYQVPISYYGYSVSEWNNNTTISGPDGNLFQINGDQRIDFKTTPTSKSSVQDSNGDGIFEFTLNFQDNAGNAVSKDFQITLLDNAIDIDGMELDGGLGNDTLSFAYPSLSSLSDIDVLLYSNSSGVNKSGGEFILVDQNGGIVSFRNFETVKINNQEFDINYGEANWQLSSVLYSANEKTALLYSHRTEVTQHNWSTNSTTVIDYRENNGSSTLYAERLQSEYHGSAATDFTIIGSAQRDNIEASSSYNSNTDTFNLGLLNISTKEGNDTVDARAGKAHSIDLGSDDDTVELYLDDILSGYLTTKTKLDGGTGSDTIDFSNSDTGYFNKTAPTLSKTSFTWLEGSHFSTSGYLNLSRYLLDDQTSAQFKAIGGTDKDLVTINNNGEVYLNWNMTPDFENPNDTDQDNIYEVSVSISDYRGHITNQDITIEVLDLDETFSGVRQYQGKTLIEMPETQSWNTRYVPLNPESSQYVTFKISGVDANAFENTDQRTSSLQFKNTVDFESPGDTNGDNIYDVTLTYQQHNNASNTYEDVSSEDIQIKITDVDESSSQGITYILNDGVAENFENLKGTYYSDTLSGDALANTITGNQGDDTLYGLDGDDRLVGDNSSNSWNSNSDDADHDTLYGGAGNDTLLGDQGNDTLKGEDGNDTIYGGTGDDILVGGAGRDVLYGDEGENNNNYYGDNSDEKGYDLFVFSLDNAANTIENADVIKDFQDGADVIAGLNLAFSQIQAEQGSVEKGTEAYSNDTILKIGDDYLAIIEGLQLSNFGEEDFTPVLAIDIV